MIADDVVEEEEEYLRLLELEDCAADFKSFVSTTMNKFTFKWYHDIVAKRLQHLAFQKDQRLMIWMPPRHGKSELLSRRWPAWRLGLDPDRKIVLASYSGSLASSFNRDAQAIMAQPQYQEIFPDTIIPESNENYPSLYKGVRYTRSGSTCEIIGREGKLYSVGVGGTLTGMGADDFIIDDPYKGPDEAYSQAIRESTWNWFTGTVLARLEGGANLVLCHTRWHKDDISGRLIREEEEEGLDGEKFEVISFPALLEELDKSGIDPREIGEALWPEKFSPERLLKTKKKIGSLFWSAIYRQSPIIQGGNIVKEGWFSTYDRVPEGATYAQSWDLTFGAKSPKASYVVGQVWARHGPFFFLVDQVRERMTFTEQEAAIIRLTNKWPQCRSIVIEEEANGRGIINRLRSKINRIYPYKPSGDKVARLEAVSPIMESGHVLLPRKSDHPWVSDWLGEMTAFPAAPNDDQVDATSQMLDYWGANAHKAIVPVSLTSNSKW